MRHRLCRSVGDELDGKLHDRLADLVAARERDGELGGSGARLAPRQRDVGQGDRQIVRELDLADADDRHVIGNAAAEAEKLQHDGGGPDLAADDEPVEFAR